jgi:hypothetical protein
VRDSPPVDTASFPVASPLTRRSLRVRLLAAVLGLACAGLLGLAARLPPDPRGYGTHQRLGFGPCGMILTTGYPCPTCGMTTAFSLTVRGQVLPAVRAQAGGFVLALMTIATLAACAWTVVSGRVPPVNYLAFSPYRLLAALLILLFGGWGLKLLMGVLDGTLPIRAVHL